MKCIRPVLRSIVMLQLGFVLVSQAQDLPNDSFQITPSQAATLLDGGNPRFYRLSSYEPGAPPLPPGVLFLIIGSPEDPESVTNCPIYWSPGTQSIWLEDRALVTEQMLTEAAQNGNLRRFQVQDQQEELQSQGPYTTTDFYLQPIAVVSNLFDLVLWGTTNGSTYLISSTEFLDPVTNSIWVAEGTLQGGTTDGTEFALGIALRTNNLFVLAQSCDEQCAATNLPLAWQLAYFGVTGVDPNGDYDSDGTINLNEYLNGTDPNKIKFRLSVTNQFVNSSLVPVSLAVAGGLPSAVAILLDSTNYSAATWAAFSSNLTVNVGTAEGWHDAWVGLRGRLDTSQQTWEWVRIKLDQTPPVLVLTSPTSTNGSQPLIQLKGYSSEALAHISYDLTNTAGLITNHQVFITSQTPGTNAWEFTTTHFQAFDVQLASGLNAITLHATDLAGNTVAISTNFTVDYSTATNPPLVQIEWPQAGTTISGTNFICNGWVDDPTATVVAKMVTTNGTTNAFTALVGRNGAFWIESLPLNSGTNLWALCITNAAGQATVTNITVIQSPLTLTINTVTPDSQLWQSHVSVTGSISDPAYAVWVNGIKGTNNGDGTWSAAAVPVTEGGAAIFDVTAYSPTEQQPDGSYGN